MKQFILHRITDVIIMALFITTIAGCGLYHGDCIEVIGDGMWVIQTDDGCEIVYEQPCDDCILNSDN